MRRIKSAPANLSLMKNRNEIKNKISNKISIFSVFRYENNEYEIKINNEITSNNEFEKNDKKENDKKKKKSIISTTSNIFSDYLFDNSSLPYEENYLISIIMSYLGNNIITKDKLKNLEAFIVQNAVRFLVSYIFHKHIISDIMENIKMYLH
tara:strand:+ start:10803 stop:11258 length:456 start_codon:yes stop_codon:yes gene_type:complete